MPAGPRAGRSWRGPSARLPAPLAGVAEPAAADAVPRRPPRSIVRAVGRAIVDFRLLRDGDRILLGLSGGKDSLGLMHALLHFRARAPVGFELEVVTIDPGTEGFRPAPLKPYVAGLGLRYHYVEEDMVQRAAEQMHGSSFSAFSARLRRGIMYRVAREQGCNVVALAQHLDDIAQSFLMSMFNAGELRTMKAHYRVDAGDLRVIRPLVYCRERQLADFARAASLPVVPDSHSVAFPEATRRAHVRELLAREERLHPPLMQNLLNAMRPLLMDAAVDEPAGEPPRS